MTVHKTSQAQLDAVQTVLRGEAVSQEPTLANVSAATTDHSIGRLWYRKRVFNVPPVPYRQGLWLLALDQELRRTEAAEKTLDNMRHGIAVLEEMLRIMHELVRPLTLFDRLFWRWRANPFLTAEIGEIEMLRSFFCSARTRYPVRAVAAIRAPRFLQQTWPMRRLSLPVGISAGWNQATLAAGGTT